MNQANISQQNPGLTVHSNAVTSSLDNQSSIMGINGPFQYMTGQSSKPDTVLIREEDSMEKQILGGNAFNSAQNTSQHSRSGSANGQSYAIGSGYVSSSRDAPTGKESQCINIQDGVYDRILEANEESHTGSPIRSSHRKLEETEGTLQRLNYLKVQSDGGNSEDDDAALIDSKLSVSTNNRQELIDVKKRIQRLLGGSLAGGQNQKEEKPAQEKQHLRVFSGGSQTSLPTLKDSHSTTSNNHKKNYSTKFTYPSAQEAESLKIDDFMRYRQQRDNP